MSFIKTLMFSHLWDGDNGDIEKMQTALVILLWTLIAYLAALVAHIFSRV